MLDETEGYAVFFYPQALEALGEAIKPYLQDGPAGPHVLCNEIDTGGALIEMTLRGRTADGTRSRAGTDGAEQHGADDRVGAAAMECSVSARAVDKPAPVVADSVSGQEAVAEADGCIEAWCGCACELIGRANALRLPVWARVPRRGGRGE